MLSALVTILLFFASFHADRLLPIHVSANKQARPIHSIYTAWNTLSRVDVEERAAQGNQPAERRMIIDAGTAATGMRDLRPNVREILQGHSDSVDDVSSVVYTGHPSARVLIIGSGGGAQVLEALKEGSTSITAVEINPTINEIAAGVMDDFWGGLFHQPQVHLVTDEGRSFLRRSPDRFDAIISVHTISNAAVASGALSLAENYVLTREAFDDYLDHLTPNGVIFFTRPEAQIARLIATARESFAARHLGSIANNVFAYTQRSTNSRTLSGRVQGVTRASFSAGFLLQKEPFTSGQLSQIRERLTAQSKAENGQLQVLYAPDAAQELPLSLYQRIVSAPDLEAIYNTNDTQLAPATDDKPFFNQHTRWSRIRWNTFVDTFSQKQAIGARMALEDRPVAELTLIVLLLQSVCVAAICILVPLAVFHRRPLGRNQHVQWLFYFAALGFGYIMVEIALLQRFLLFLGQPIYTYAVVLAGLLIFTGIGSWAAGRVSESSPRYPNRALLFALLTVLVLSFVTGPIFHLALGWPLPIRIVISLLLVGPLGFALGQPFPLGLRMATASDSSLGAWAWGVNGFFTVIGTVLALMLGMIFGFRTVLLLSGFCYVIAILAMWQLTKSPVAQSTTEETIPAIG
ncbi:MAG: hypothetical protein NVS9B15_08640 [Acidobacteriaceae bacterium]